MAGLPPWWPLSPARGRELRSLLPYLVDTPRIQAYIATAAVPGARAALSASARLSFRVLPLPAMELRNLEVADDPKFGTAPS